MDDLWLLPGPSDVNVDLSRLQGETVGDETHYVVGLDASPRSEWLDAWRHVQSSSAVLRRFRIDPEEAIVRFTCRTADGTGMVFDALQHLEVFVKRVNDVVAARRAATPHVSPVPNRIRAR